VRKNMLYLCFHISLISVNIMSSISIHFGANDRIYGWIILYCVCSYIYIYTHILLYTYIYIIFYLCIDPLIHLWHLGWIHFLAIVNSAATSMGMQLSLWYAALNSFG
jgi:hypothetical protein